jgi:hypothetical protein
MSLVEAPEAFLFGRLTGQTAVSSQIGTAIFPLLAPSGHPDAAHDLPAHWPWTGRRA